MTNNKKWEYRKLFFTWVIFNINLFNNATSGWVIIIYLFVWRLIQGNSRKGFGRCRLSCLSHYVHYLSIPLYTNSWDDISRTLSYIQKKIWYRYGIVKFTVWKCYCKRNNETVSIVKSKIRFGFHYNLSYDVQGNSQKRFGRCRLSCMCREG